MTYTLHQDPVLMARLAALTRNERRSWLLHQAVADYFDPDDTHMWLSRYQPLLQENIARIRARTQGEPHMSNIAEWERMIEASDIQGIKNACKDLTRYGIEMREVSPINDIIDQKERTLLLDYDKKLRTHIGK